MRTKRKLFAFWLILLVLYLAVVGFTVGYNLYQVAVLYSRAFRAAATAICIIATTLFFWFTLFFFSVKYRLTKHFCKMLSDAQTGVSDTAEGVFIAFNDEKECKDGVDFYSMLLDVKPLKRDDVTLRKVLIERTRPRPPFEAGMKIRLRAHANILMAYEILSAAPKTDAPVGTNGVSDVDGGAGGSQN